MSWSREEERAGGEVLQTLKRGVKLREEDDCKIANLARWGVGGIVVRGGVVLCNVNYAVGTLQFFPPV